MPRHRLATTRIVADLLIDTDVFIDHLRGAAELKPRCGDSKRGYGMLVKDSMKLEYMKSASVSLGSVPGSLGSTNQPRDTM